MKYYGFSVRCIEDEVVFEDDDATEEPYSGVFSMTVQATKAANNVFARTWRDGEIVKVVYGSKVIGQLTAKASSDGTTILSGEVDEKRLPGNGKTLTFYLHETTFRYDNQNGLLTNGDGKSIANDYDYDYCSASVSIDRDNKTVSVKDGITFKNPAQAVIKFTLKNKAGKPIEADQLVIVGSIPPADGIVDLSERWNGTFLLDVDMLTGSSSKGNIIVTSPSPTSTFYVVHP